MSNVLGNVTCGCGSPRCVVTEAKGGTLSGRCPDCGAQVLVKAPNGVAAWRARLGKPAAPKASNQDSFAAFVNGGQS